MGQLRTFNKTDLPEIKADNKRVIVEFNQDISNEVATVLTEQIKELSDVLLLKMEQQEDAIKSVERKIETKHITPQQLSSLESLVDRKARKYVDKRKGIQINIDVLLNNDVGELVEYQKLVNEKVGKTKSEIWVSLNKDCLERKGTEPKNKILATQVDEAFDFVRSWGGFSI